MVVTSLHARAPQLWGGGTDFTCSGESTGSCSPVEVFVADTSVTFVKERLPRAYPLVFLNCGGCRLHVRG